MVLQRIDRSACGSSSFDPDSCGAARLAPLQRRDLSLEALRRTEPLEKATAAIDHAFQPPGLPDHHVMFWLPVAQDWLEHLVLSLTLICHSSYRGVMELLETLFDYRQISLGRMYLSSGNRTAAKQRNSLQTLPRKGWFTGPGGRGAGGFNAIAPVETRESRTPTYVWVDSGRVEKSGGMQEDGLRRVPRAIGGESCFGCKEGDSAAAPCVAFPAKHKA